MKNRDVIILMVFLILITSCKNRVNNQKESMKGSSSNGEVRGNQQVQAFDNLIFNLNLDATVTNQKGQAKKVRTISKSSSLFFRFSINMCSDCYNNELTILNRLGPSQKKRMILLTSFNSINAFKIYLSRRLFDFPVYNISENELSKFYAESLNVPYYFSVSGTGDIENIHISDKANPTLSNRFLERYFGTKIK